MHPRAKRSTGSRARSEPPGASGPVRPPWGRPRRLARLALLPLLAGLGCGDGGPRSGPGIVTAEVRSPNGPEGAALIELLGAGIDGVESESGWIFSSSGPESTRVLVVLDRPGPLRFRVAVPDTTAPPGAVVLEVADGANDLRSNPGAYRVEFVR